MTAPGKVSEATSTTITKIGTKTTTAGGAARRRCFPRDLEFKPLTPLTAEDSQLVEESVSGRSATLRESSTLSPWLLGQLQPNDIRLGKEATRSFATLTLAPWVARVEAAFQATVLSPAYRLKFDLGALTKADFESFSAALLRGPRKAAGCRRTTAARNRVGHRVAGGDDIAPPVSGGQPAATNDTPSTDPAPTEPAPADDGGKIRRPRQAEGTQCRLRNALSPPFSAVPSETPNSTRVRAARVARSLSRRQGRPGQPSPTGRTRHGREVEACCGRLLCRAAPCASNRDAAEFLRHGTAMV